MNETIDACAGSMKIGKGITRALWISTLGFVMGVSFFLNGMAVHAATRQDLQNEINSLALSVDQDVAQGLEIINAITVAISPPLSVTAGTIGGTRGSPATLPVYFKEGSGTVSALQFDLALSSGVSVTAVDPGLSSQAAGKSIQWGIIPTGVRVLIFGLNSTSLSSGPVALLRLAVGPTAPLGKHVIPVSGTAASNPSGVGVPVTSNNGSLTVK